MSEAISLDISSTFAKGIGVLKVFDGAEADLSLAQIARRAGLDRAVARRLVLTLVHLGYVRRSGRAFTLTPKVLVLACGFLQSRQFTKAVVPILNQYSRQIDAQIHLAVRDGFDAVYLAHATQERGQISFGFSVGSRLPLLQTAIGRALVAFAPDEDARDLLANAPLSRFTDQSASDRDEIAAELEIARERGYVHADGAFEAGVAAIAVPLLNADRSVGAIGISSESEDFTEDHIRKVTRTLRACRNDLSDVVKTL